MQEQELLAYACEKFQNGIYDEALEVFVLAYYKGYEREWIIENIYNCYMAGNESEFKSSFEAQAVGSGFSYEECVLDFIPCRDGEYYIFDKEMSVFHGKFSVNELQNTEADKLFKQLEFSPAALELDWNWNDAKHILVEAKERNIYAVCHDMNRSISFWKIPELKEFWKNVKLFASFQEMQKYFHENTAIYLPKVFYGQHREEFNQIMEQEHQYRLTPEGRNVENVLLTICIPTCNRGNLLLERMEKLLQMEYDAEIEIAISKNGTSYYQEEYEEVSRISDARMNYFDHGRDLKPHGNWHYSIEMAHGKYVMIVSDEDDVILSALEHYMKLLQKNPELNLVRAKTDFQYILIEKRTYAKRGIDAFRSMFLNLGYLSGLIIRRQDFIEENLLELDKYSDNPFYCNYPHEWWGAILSKKGDYMEENVSLISEGESVLTGLQAYATYEARLKQFRGQADFLHEMMENDIEAIFEGLLRSITKTEYLLELAREWKFDKEEYLKMVDKFLKMSVEILDEFALEEEQRKKLLILIKNSGIELLNYHVKVTVEESLEG